MLQGREDERAVIDGLLAAARAGRSGTLVLRGEAGIGKTALLDYAADSGADLPVLRGVGIESETRLPFAALHLLLKGNLDPIGSLPRPQADALRGALGLGSAAGGDRFLVGLAVLSLLTELAGDGPLLCLLDDAQWIDQASADVLLFTARRLESEGIALILAARDGVPAFVAPGLPELRLSGLDGAAAAGLLAEHAGAMSAAVRDRVLTEAAGNPLALIELPGLVTEGDETDDTAGLAVSDRIEQLYRTVVGALPQRARDLLLVAAADDSGELAAVLQAAQEFGASADDLAVAERAQLVRITSTRIAFRHPLIRAATYHGAPVTSRWAAHRALAGAIGDTDPERRTHHLAAIATGPDESIAAALDRSARSAHERGGLSSALAGYERAAELTADPTLRAERLTRAAEAADELGNYSRATELTERAEPLADDPFIQARLATVRGHACYAGSELVQAHHYLHSAAAILLTRRPQEALWLLVEMARISRGTGVDTVAVDTAELLDSLELPATDPLVSIRDVVRWLIYRQIGKDPASLPPLPETASLALQVGAGGLRERLFTANACLIAGDSPPMYEAVDELVATIRAQGAVGLMPEALINQAEMQIYRGRHREARATASEAARIAEDTGQHNWMSLAGSMLALIAALDGDEEACRSHAETALRGPEQTAPGSVGAQWALGLLDLGLGRMESVARLQALADGPTRFQMRVLRSAPDLVEAAVRADRPAIAEEALGRYEQWACQTRRPWVQAMLLRCRALLAPEDEAERYYVDALDKHEADRPFEVARTMLLYGEWLRRVRRRPSDARAQLRSALDVFERVGAHPWVERARRELRAAGESIATAERMPDGFDQLTPQELQIVRLAAMGLSNRAIGAQLFLSPRTIGYHLYKAYPKLGVASRGELARLGLDAD